MAKLPRGVAAAFSQQNNDAAKIRGTAGWLKTLPKRKRDAFMATFEAYLKGRADGSISLSYDGFVLVLKSEFGFPFDWTAARNFMKKHWPELFERQKLHR